MQLFFTDFVVQDDLVLVTEPRVVFQCRQVLRMRVGDVFELQYKTLVPASVAVRYRVAIVSLTKDSLRARVIDSHVGSSVPCSVALCIALPNNTKKLSLIVQKLSEIWVVHIVFWRAERSQLWLEIGSRVAKLSAIAMEAVEQSKWWVLPTITFVEDVLSWVSLYSNSSFFVFDNKAGSVCIDNVPFPKTSSLCWFVWPEGWFSDKDYSLFDSFPFTLLSLGDPVLRMETAAIVWGRELVSYAKELKL